MHIYHGFFFFYRDSESSYSEAEDEVFEEAADQPLTTAGATLLLAHEWTKRYGGDKSSRINGTGNGNSPTDSGRDAHLEEDDELSSRESDSESDGNLDFLSEFFFFFFNI